MAYWDVSDKISISFSRIIEIVITWRLLWRRCLSEAFAAGTDGASYLTRARISDFGGSRAIRPANLGSVGRRNSTRPVLGDKMLGLSGGTTPTYQACKADTLFEGQADTAAGTEFCLIEAGKTVGVTVTINANTASPPYLVLHVVVWQQQ